VLIIAVIGGLSRLEGAWIGAFAYVLIDYYSRQYAPTWGLWINPGRSDTIIGLVFLFIVLLSPDGLVGVGQRARGLIFRRDSGETPSAQAPASGAQAVPEQAGTTAAGGSSGSGPQGA
jgi:branched-chain amino acid transport system permease protein